MLSQHISLPQVLIQLKRDPRVWIRWLSGHPLEEAEPAAPSGQQWKKGGKRGKKGKKPAIPGVRPYHQAVALVLHRASTPSTAVAGGSGVGPPSSAAPDDIASAAARSEEEEEEDAMLEDIWKMASDDRIRAAVGWLSQLRSRWV